jgi:hypothetical protein
VRLHRAGRFETQWLAAPENLSAIADVSGEWIDLVHGRRPPSLNSRTKRATGYANRICIAGCGQGAGTLSSQGQAAEHADQARVRAHEEMPFGPLSASSAVRHILIKHAKAAGLHAPSLGNRVLRHSNAARQLDLGTRPRVLSDLFGHRDPKSISAYVRIATQSLRDVSLPLPT